MKYSVLLFYKYVAIENPEQIREEHFNFCSENNILGRIFLSHEGINGTASGLKEDIEKYKAFVRNNIQFADIIFKEDPAECNAFNKLHVRVKKEIVHSGLDGVDLKNGGKRLTPQALNKFYEEGKDFLIVDARNIYESRIGRFRNAVTPDMQTFRDWKNAVDELQDYKDKTIVTYCTGGIRCEKASAYMVEQGFSDVYQLEGGIVTYTKQFPDKYWEGSVFVFDERRIVEPNTDERLKHIGKCYYCGTPSSYYINCHNQECDKLLVTCETCKVENDYCCSDECRASENKRKRFHG